MCLNYRIFDHLHFIKSHISEVIGHKVRGYWSLVYIYEPRISEFADNEPANNEVHLYYNWNYLEMPTPNTERKIVWNRKTKIIFNSKRESIFSPCSNVYEAVKNYDRWRSGSFLALSFHIWPRCQHRGLWSVTTWP